MKENRYSDILSNIKKLINGIKVDHGISIEPLNEAIDELGRHAKNIEVIEDNIEAVREEVIDKIKDELDQNKKASKFSIFGFYVGAIGLFLAIASTTMVIIDKNVSNELLVENGNSNYNDFANSIIVNQKFIKVFNQDNGLNSLHQIFIINDSRYRAFDCNFKANIGMYHDRFLKIEQKDSLLSKLELNDSQVSIHIPLMQPLDTLQFSLISKYNIRLDWETKYPYRIPFTNPIIDWQFEHSYTKKNWK